MRDPAVLLYTSDFLVGTMFMTMEERGQYITLLCMQHQKGGLPEGAFAGVSPAVREKFSVREDGLFYNERMAIEIEKREEYLEQRRECGRLGGAPKGNQNARKKTVVETVENSETDEKKQPKQPKNKVKTRSKQGKNNLLENENDIVSVNIDSLNIDKSDINHNEKFSFSFNNNNNSACAKEEDENAVVENSPPGLAEVYIYFHGRDIDRSKEEAEKFLSYNEYAGWSCLPNWKQAADRWITRIEEMR